MEQGRGAAHAVHICSSWRPFSWPESSMVGNRLDTINLNEISDVREAA
jgi:hypothetical protein